MHKDSTFCPLCQNANNCAISVDKTATACWCQNTSFTSELIAAANTKASSASCICKTCAEQALRLSSELD